jgi:MYXO-CTERM domain-containing protein
MKLVRLSALAIVALSGFASADNVVVPNAYTNARGPTGASNLTRGDPRTYQLQMTAAEVQATGLAVGNFITGVAWRMQSSTSNSNLTAAADWSDYEITLGGAANAIGSMGFNYAANMTNPLLVRDGPLTLNPFPFNPALPAPAPQDFQEITFQNNYTYQGGDLVILFTHTGHNNVFDPFMDSEFFGQPSVRALQADGFQTATGTNFTNCIIQRLTFEVPSPAGLALLGLGGLVAGRRRRA